MNIKLDIVKQCAMSLTRNNLVPAAIKGMCLRRNVCTTGKCIGKCIGNVGKLSVQCDAVVSELEVEVEKGYILDKASWQWIKMVKLCNDIDEKKEPKKEPRSEDWYVCSEDLRKISVIIHESVGAGVNVRRRSLSIEVNAAASDDVETNVAAGNSNPLQHIFPPVYDLGMMPVGDLPIVHGDGLYLSNHDIGTETDFGLHRLEDISPRSLIELIRDIKPPVLKRGERYVADTAPASKNDAAGRALLNIV